MKDKFGVIVIPNSELIECLETVESILNGKMDKSLKDIIALTKGKHDLNKIPALVRLDLNDDAEFFSKLSNVVESYSKAIPALRKQIMTELPSNMTTNTSNINSKMAFAMVSLGIFLANNLSDVLVYLLENNYNLEKNTLDDSYTRDSLNKLNSLAIMLPELEKAKFDTIVSVIGNVPVLKKLRGERASVIPDSTMQSFMTETFKIHDKATKGILSRIINTFSFSSENDTHRDVINGFTGNPIMYIRLFLVDIKAMRLNYNRDRIRLLENRILELSKNEDNLPNDKVVKAIKYYEEAVTKHQYKIERLSQAY